MDFNFIDDVTEFHSCYKIMNTATGKADKLHDIFELHYVELSKFAQQQPTQIITALDRWSTFLTKAHQLDKNHIPAELAVDAAIVKAISAVDRMFDEEERLIYEIRMQSLADIESIIASANDKGFGQGMERGVEKMALNMLAKGMPTADIAEITGLSAAVILQLVNNKIN